MGDIRKTLPPNGSVNIAASGDFVFCRYADAPVRLIVDNTDPMALSTGDKRRPPGRFKSFLLENPHDRPIAVVVHVSEGDFTSQIIQGEVAVIPGVRGVDGQWRNDSRRDLTFFITPLDDSGTVYDRDVPLRVAPARSDGFGSTVNNGVLYAENMIAAVYRDNDTPSRTRIQFYDAKLRPVRRRDDLPLVDGEDPRRSAQDFAWSPQTGWLCLDGGRRTLPQRDRAVYSFTGVGVIARFGLGLPESSGQTGLNSMDFGPDGLLYIARDDGVIYVVRPSNAMQWELVRTIQAPNTVQGLRFDRETGQPWRIPHSSLASDPIARLDPNTFEVVETFATPDNFGGTGSGWRGAVKSGNFIWRGQYDHGAVQLRNLETFSSPVRLAVSQGSRACRDYAERVWRVDDSPIITADVTAYRSGNAVIVDGEVIRAALTVATGAKVGGGYMDHVFAFAHSGDLPGQAPAVRTSGGRSFAAAGIDDAFSVTLPAEIKITVDDGLPLLAPALTV